MDFSTKQLFSPYKYHWIEVYLQDQDQSLSALIMLTNHRFRFSFGAGFVLSACHGHQVSFNTTVK